MSCGEVIGNKLYMDHTFMEHSRLQISDIIELWNTCMRTAYFQSKLKFFKEKKAWQWKVHFLQLSAIYIYGPV